MASPEIIDINALLNPISDDFPGGFDIRQDSSPNSNYQMVKIARAAARAAERNSVHDGETGEADEQWRKILKLAPEILSHQSKDLEVVSWLTEALARRYGFQGLRDSFKLIEGLLERYWDNLHPMPDEDGIETRTSPLSGLNGEGAEGVLIAPIRKIPITEGYSPGPFSLWQYQQALEAQRSTDENTRANKIANLGFSLENVEKAVNDSSTEFFIDQLDDVNEAIIAYKNVARLLDQYCGQSSPSTRNIVDVLEECRGAINHIGKHKLPVAAVEETLNNNGTEVTNSSTHATTQVSAVNSRDAALRQISEIAQFFRKTEPHSPISYVLEKAVKWGSMSLNELIVELIPDSSSRERFGDLTGAKNEE